MTRVRFISCERKKKILRSLAIAFHLSWVDHLYSSCKFFISSKKLNDWTLSLTILRWQNVDEWMPFIANRDNGNWLSRKQHVLFDEPTNYRRWIHSLSQEIQFVLISPCRRVNRNDNFGRSSPKYVFIFFLRV